MSTTRGFYRELEKQPLDVVDVEVGCGGLTRSSAAMYIALEAAVMAVERRGQLVQMTFFSQPVCGDGTSPLQGRRRA